MKIIIPKLNVRIKLLIFLSSIALSSPSALANIYRIDLNNYTIDPTRSDITGTLSGFIIIDESLVNGDSDYNRTSVAGPIDIPSWITAASITFTRSGGEGQGETVTKTLTSALFPLDEMNWRVKQSTVDNGGFDPSQEFVSQMDTFGLINGIQFTGNPGGGVNSDEKMVQQFYSSEALLESPITSTPAPGPLPLLGLPPLAWYFRKFKKQSIKN